MSARWQGAESLFASSTRMLSVWALLTLLVVVPFRVHDTQAVSLIGEAAFLSFGAIAIFAAAFHILVYRRDATVTDIVVWSCFAALLSIHIIYAVSSGFNSRSIISLMQICFVASTLIAFSGRPTFTNTLPPVKVASAVAIVALAGLVLYYVASDRSGEWLGGFPNTNAMGLTVLQMLVLSGLWASSSRMTFGALCVAALFLILATGSRSSLVAAVLFGGVTLAWPYLRRSVLLLWAPLVAVLVGTLGVVVYFSTSQTVTSPLGQLVFRLTAKRIDSGRGDVWSDVINAIGVAPLFGHGTSSTSQAVTNVGHSSHNWHLEIIYQMGALGYLLYLAIALIVWRTLVQNADNPSAGVLGGTLVSVLFVQCFEITLTQNNLGFGLLFWMAAGLVLSFQRK